MYFFMFAYDNLPDQADAHRQRKKRDHTGTWKHVFMFHGDSFDLYCYISYIRMQSHCVIRLRILF
jgi:hypothetical protein